MNTHCTRFASFILSAYKGFSVVIKLKGTNLETGMGLVKSRKDHDDVFDS